ncbi:unnamed protein product [Ixodes persulcatus]
MSGCNCVNQPLKRNRAYGFLFGGDRSIGTVSGPQGRQFHGQKDHKRAAPSEGPSMGHLPHSGPRASSVSSLPGAAFGPALLACPCGSIRAPYGQPPATLFSALCQARFPIFLSTVESRAEATVSGTPLRLVRKGCPRAWFLNIFLRTP